MHQSPSKNKTWKTIETEDIPHFLLFLLKSNVDDLEAGLSSWSRGIGKVLKVVPWVETLEFEWSLIVDLKSLGKPGQSAILPFPWAETHNPSTSEAVFAWRLYANEMENNQHVR